MNDNSYEKRKKIIRIVCAIFGIVVFITLAIFVYDTINTSDDSLIVNNSAIIGYIGIALLILIIFLFFFGNLYNKRYRKKLMENKPMQRFIYLDTFYYEVMVYRGSDKTFEFKTYYVLQDKNTKKIYTISGNYGSTNVSFQYILGKASIWVGKGIKNRKEVPFNSEGSLWVEEEISDYLKYDGEKIIFDDTKKSISKDEIYNCNPQYDLSLLEKSTFIVGLADFDTDDKK